MALTGIVTKAGFMNKTATVTVSRFVFHKVTRKVRPSITIEDGFALTAWIFKQRIVRSKKYLVHDEHNSMFHAPMSSWSYLSFQQRS